ncbi:MAG: hypothetical protein AMXMBFR13_01990 [Phycisphaerae bacterium]
MSSIIIEEKIRIPGHFPDIASFRDWARSDEFPETGRYSFLNGEVWVDMSPERLFSHNQVNGEFAIVIGTLVKANRLGRYFHDRTLLSHPEAGLSTEPDGLFVSRDSIRSGRVKWIEGAEESVEIEGSPDMVLEVVSPTSQRKDTVVLRGLYWQAGIREYWLVDARTEPLQFEIFAHEAEGYTPVPGIGGWVRSEVFDKQFRLTVEPDELGDPVFALLTR